MRLKFITWNFWSDFNSKPIDTQDELARSTLISVVEPTSNVPNFSLVLCLCRWIFAFRRLLQTFWASNLLDQSWSSIRELSKLKLLPTTTMKLPANLCQQCRRASCVLSNENAAWGSCDMSKPIRMLAQIMWFFLNGVLWLVDIVWSIYSVPRWYSYILAIRVCLMLVIICKLHWPLLIYPSLLEWMISFHVSYVLSNGSPGISLSLQLCTYFHLRWNGISY